MLQTFVNRCLRSIMGIRLPKVISNTRLWEVTGENPQMLRIRMRKWQWVGHAVTKRDDFTGGAWDRGALDWNLEEAGKCAETWS